MEQTEITITPEMIEAAQEVYKAKLLRCKKPDDWLAELPLDEPIETRRNTANYLHKRALWRDSKANDHFRRLVPDSEVRRELLDMVEREAQ